MAEINFLRLPSLCKQLDVTRNTVYDKLNPNSPRYDETFPSPVKTGSHSVCWVESEVLAWMQDKIAQRNDLLADAEKLAAERAKRKARADRATTRKAA